MAHYSSVDENALISSINNCKNKLNMKSTANLLEDANSMPWDGAEAKDNLVNAIKQIDNKTKKLSEQLDFCLEIAKKIKKYKQVKKELDKLKQNKNNLKKRYESDPLSPSAAYLQGEISRKQASINSKEEELNRLKSKLTSAGYPPV